MRVIPLLLVASCSAQSPFGNWTLNRARSSYAGETRPKSLTLRIEPHAKGEVVTVDRTEANGQAITSSVLLYFDGVKRDFQDAGCVGTQSSRRVDSQTVEIRRGCVNGDWTRFFRQMNWQRKELIVEISGERSGRRFERRVVLDKQ